MKIYEIRSKSVQACPGSEAQVAEAGVELEDGTELFVTLQLYEGEEYTVSEDSVYEFLAGNASEPAERILEHYSEWVEARSSAYAPVFKKLRSTIAQMGVV